MPQQSRDPACAPHGRVRTRELSTRLLDSDQAIGGRKGRAGSRRTTRRACGAHRDSAPVALETSALRAGTAIACVAQHPQLCKVTPQECSRPWLPRSFSPRECARWPAAVRWMAVSTTSPSPGTRPCSTARRTKMRIRRESRGLDRCRSSRTSDDIRRHRWRPVKSLDARAPAASHRLPAEPRHSTPHLGERRSRAASGRLVGRSRAVPLGRGASRYPTARSSGVPPP